MTSEVRIEIEDVGFVSAVSGMICVLPNTCLDGSLLIEHSRFDDDKHIKMIGCYAPIINNEEDLSIRDNEYSITISNDKNQPYSSFFNTNNSDKLLIIDPFIFFDDEKTMFSGSIVAILKGRHSNFLLRNCGVLEGDSVVLKENDYASFDAYVKTFNKKNKSSVVVNYKPFGIPYIARAKTKTLEKNGVIQTPFGDMFVMRTVDMDGDFKVSSRENNLMVNKFNERDEE